MTIITITSQKEWNALPKEFKDFTVIEIISDEKITIKDNPINSSAVLYGNSSAVLRDNSRAILRGNSRAILRGNSRAVLWGNSSADLWDNSSAELWDNSSAELWDNSSAELWDNSSAELRGNSRAVLWDNSRAVLWGNSSADAYLCSTLFINSSLATINSLLDNTHLIYKVPHRTRPLKQDSTAKITEFEDLITPSFEQWLDRGYVVADGIHQRLVSKKTIGELSVFDTTDFSENEKFVVVKKGDLFAHGKTFDEAKDALKYKLSDRDTSQFSRWKLTDVKNTDELIQAYMAITGACGLGTKMFCESMALKDSYTVQEVIEMTNNSYGHDEFKNFGWRK